MRWYWIVLIALLSVGLIGGALYYFFVYKKHKGEMELHFVTQSTGAACQDGTPTGYYFAKGSDENADKFVVYFLGGGFCLGTNK